MGPLSDPNRQPAQPTQNDQVWHEEPSYREHVTNPLGSANFPPAPPSYPQPAQYPYNQQGQQMPVYPTYPQQQQPAYPQQGQYPPTYGYPGQQQQQNGYYQPQHYQQPQYGHQNGYYQPQYQGYPGYYGYQGYAPYPYYGYRYPTGPKQDTYLHVIAILAVICSSLVSIGGLISAGFLVLLSFVPSSRFAGQESSFFSGVVLFLALAIAGCLGGGFGLYHSIRSLLRKPSAAFKLPWWWLFLAAYVVVIIIAIILRANGLETANLPFTVFLIALAGILPALTFLALGVRRLHFPREVRWPTRWRRFAFAIVSGATLSVVLALVFESILTLVAAGLLRTSSGFSLDNPNQPLPTDPRALGFLFVLVSVIAPLVEETVKPLAVIALIGRIESAAEAFVLGLSCGIGFDLIETSGYISSGYHDWLNVALQRSTAGLLHGLGAAMVSLGWYYLTHPKASNNRFLLGFGCMLYAVLQHAIWNGSFGLQLLPAPIGPYLSDGTIGSGSFAFPSFLLVYIVESIIMLVVFFFVTGKIRKNNTLTPPKEVQTERQPAPPVQRFQQVGMR